MLRTGTPSVNDRAWYPPDIGDPGREANARARMQTRAISVILSASDEERVLRGSFWTRVTAP
jgi:hypothetical protein